MFDHRWNGSGALMGALLTFSLLFGAGCSQSSDGKAEVVPEAPEKPIKTLDDIQLPLAAYEISNDQVTKLEQTQRRLNNECTRARGGTRDRTAPNGMETFLAERKYANQRLSATWGAFDPETMRQRGYHVSTGRGVDYSMGKAPGDVVDKCDEEVRHKMPMGRDWDALASAENMLTERPDPAEDNPKLVKARKAWSECMKKQGFNYQSPKDAMTNFLSGPQKSDELKTAEADLSCKESTKFMDVAVAVVVTRQNQVIAHDKQTLNKYKSSVEEFLKKNS